MRSLLVAVFALWFAGCVQPPPWVDGGPHWGPCPVWDTVTIKVEPVGFNSSLQEVVFEQSSNVHVNLSCAGPGDREGIRSGADGVVSGQVTSLRFEKITFRFADEVLRVLALFEPMENGTLRATVTEGNLTLNWKGHALLVNGKDFGLVGDRQDVESVLSARPLRGERLEIPIHVNSSWNEGIYVSAMIQYTNAFEGNLDTVPNHGGWVNVTLRDPDGSVVDTLTLGDPWESDGISRPVLGVGRWVVEVEATPDSDPEWNFEWDLHVVFRY